MELPEEVQVEILLRLPVRSLLICKCVCKLFRAFIQDPDFDHRHRRTVSRFMPDDCTTELLLVQSDHDIYIVLTDKTTDDVISRTPLTTQIPDMRNLFLVGSCNGLVCFSARAKNEWDYLLVLWDPVTRETRYLPQPQKDRSWYHYGYIMEFCFVPETNDYIVLIIGSSSETEWRISVAVYKMSTDSWTIQCSNLSNSYFSGRDIKHQMTSVFLNGTYYWGTTVHGCNILSYDLKDGNFREIKTPINHDELERKHGWNLAVIEESLGLMHWNCRNNKGEVLVLKKEDHGVEDSWLWIGFCKTSLSPLLGYWKNRLITTDSSNLYLYDPHSNTKKRWISQSGLPRICSFLDTMAP